MLAMARTTCAAWTFAVFFASPAALASQESKRPVTIPDIIQMTNIDGNNPWEDGVVRPAVFSPDGGRFAIVVTRGHLENNTNVSSILVFQADRLFRSPRPDTVATFASSTSRPPIANVQWLPGGSELIFLGERPHETPQVYRLDLRTREIRPITRSSTPVLSYNVAADGSRILYVADAPGDSAAWNDMAARGFVVTGQVRDILNGRWNSGASHSTPQEIYAVSLRDGNSRKVRAEGIIDCGDTPVMSPNGRFAVMRCGLPELPAHWTYMDKLRGWAVVPVMTLLDLERGTAEPLFDAPWYRTEVEWAPDGGALLVKSTFLPLKGVDAAEQRARSTLKATVMLDPATREMTILARRDSLEVEQWSPDGKAVVLRSTGAESVLLGFKEEGDRWVSVDPGTVPAAKGSTGRTAAALDVFIEQDLNTPPRLVARNAARTQATIFDPNPQFAELAFAREQVFKWMTPDGEWIAGLYYPVGYQPGKRYPVVIQTHGFTPDRFQIEGYGRTGYAAQALAGAGIMVLQLAIEPSPASRNTLSTKEEGPFNVRGIEALIDSLDRRRLIDRDKVGLQGWSRTTYGVRYMLTHSDYPIAAALISDGVDFSYLRYLIDDDMFKTTAEGMNGGVPIGDDFAVWQERVPSLNPQKIATPLRIEAIQYPGGGGPLTPP